LQYAFVKGDSDLCAGCGICEIICSLSHESECRPSIARLRISRDIFTGFSEITTCIQCNDFPCSEVCTVNAFIKDDKLGIMVIDKNLCAGCKVCIDACPYNIIQYDVNERVAVKCDLCGGMPNCVQFCPMGALKMFGSGS